MAPLSIYWNVDPILFSIGPFQIRYYGLMFIFAFATGSYMFWNILKRKGESPQLFLSLLNTVFLSMLIGARLGECLFYYPSYYLQHPVQIIFPFADGRFTGFQGLSSHGAAIGILVGLYLFSRNSKLSFLWLLDRMAIVVALACMFVRIGNLFNSELYGTPTNLPWGFQFIQKGEMIARHPVQLYEAIAYFLIFLFLCYLSKKIRIIRIPGLVFGLFLILIFTARFLLEYLKSPLIDADNNISLQIGQYLSLPFILAGAMLLMVIVMRSDLKKDIFKEE